MGDRIAEFRLVPVAAFDARRGYSRWVTPGIGTRSAERGSLAEADLWVDRQGNLFTRFTSQGYSLHFRIKSVLCAKIAPEMKDSIEDFLYDMLITWVVDGIDDDFGILGTQYLILQNSLWSHICKCVIILLKGSTPHYLLKKILIFDIGWRKG